MIKPWRRGLTGIAKKITVQSVGYCIPALSPSWLPSSYEGGFIDSIIFKWGNWLSRVTSAGLGIQNHILWDQSSQSLNSDHTAEEKR